MGINRDFRDLFSELCAAEARFLIIGLLRNKRAVARPQVLLDVEWLERAKEHQELDHD